MTGAAQISERSRREPRRERAPAQALAAAPAGSPPLGRSAGGPNQGRHAGPSAAGETHTADGPFGRDPGPSLALTHAALAAAQTGLGAARVAVEEIRELVWEATRPGADRPAIGADISELQATLLSLAQEANPVTCSLSMPVSEWTAGAVGLPLDVTLASFALTGSTAGGAGLLDRERTAGGTTASIVTLDIGALTNGPTDGVLAIVEDACADIDHALGAIGRIIDWFEDEPTPLASAAAPPPPQEAAERSAHTAQAGSPVARLREAEAFAFGPISLADLVGPAD